MRLGVAKEATSSRGAQEMAGALERWRPSSRAAARSLRAAACRNADALTCALERLV